MIYGLDLFSGIGGLTLALSEWVRPVAYCENDRYAQAVLLSQIGRGFIPFAPIWDDIRTLRGNDVGSVDIIYGGFPCQDISDAGARAGLEGERSRLYFELRRLVSELRPRFVFLENVAAITHRGLERISLDFTSMGYDSRWTIVSAAEVGAPHPRERWWLMAHANGPGLSESRSLENTRRKDLEQPRRSTFGGIQVPSWETPARDVCGMDDGLPLKTHRIRALGNAVVPMQAREAFVRLMGVD